jgi:hypothetical protein
MGMGRSGLLLLGGREDGLEQGRGGSRAFTNGSGRSGWRRCLRGGRGEELEASKDEGEERSPISMVADLQAVCSPTKDSPLPVSSSSHTPP